MSKPINFFHAGEINANVMGSNIFAGKKYKIFYVSKLIGIFAADTCLKSKTCLMYLKNVSGMFFPAVPSSAPVSA